MGERPPGIRILIYGEVHTRRPYQLADYDPLGSIDHERARARHHRDVTDEQGLFLDLALAGTLGLDLQFDSDVERGREGGLLLSTFLLGLLRVFEIVVAKAELEPTAREVLYRGDILEDLPQALSLEPVERVELYLNQVRYLEDGWGSGIGPFVGRYLAVGHLQCR